MIDICVSYDFYKDYDQKAYGEWAKKAIVPLLRSPGIIGFRAYRNLFGSPQVRLTMDWQTLSHRAKFAEGSE